MIDFKGTEDKKYIYIIPECFVYIYLSTQSNKYIFREWIQVEKVCFSPLASLCQSHLKGTYSLRVCIFLHCISLFSR